MDPSDQPRFYYLIILLVMLLASFIVTSRGRGREVWRAARWWVLIFGVAILGAAFWPDIKPRVLSVVDPSGGHKLGDQIIFRKGDDDHFYARADVNGVPISFIVDTGASRIALTKADAARAGFNPAKLNYAGLSSTANGVVRTADVQLETITIGGQTFRNVGASVLDGDLDVSLMGMSFLSRFGKLSIEGDRLILEN